MAVSTATGTVDTETILADERVVDMENEFRLLDPDETQFMTMLNKLPSRPAIREKINWLEDQYFPNQSSLGAAISATTQTAVTVATGEGAYFRAGDLVRVASTGEMLEVSSVASDVLTVVRSIGGVAAATAASADQLLIVSNVAAQGADIGAKKVTLRVLGYNYTQIVRHPFGFTNTEVEIETYGAGDPMNEIAKKAVEHKRSLEWLLFQGARDFSSAAPSSKGYMGGAFEFISTNVSSSIGTLTRATLDSKLQAIFQHGSRNKVIFAAPVPAAAVSGLLADNWVRAQPGERVYGAKVNAFITGAYGDRVPIVVKRDWGTFSASGNGLGTWMYVLDMDYIRKRPLRNRGTRLLRNRQGNGEDQTVHEYLTELSMEFSVEKAHGILKGITG